MIIYLVVFFSHSQMIISLKIQFKKSKKATLTKNNVDVSNSRFLSTMKIQA